MKLKKGISMFLVLVILLSNHMPLLADNNADTGSGFTKPTVVGSIGQVSGCIRYQSM